MATAKQQAPAKEQQAQEHTAVPHAASALKQLVKEDLELITPRGRCIGPIRQPPEETTYIPQGNANGRATRAQGHARG